MMKILMIVLMFPFSALAMDCLVDGISDSPQRGHCYIQHGKEIENLNVNCKDGVYFLVWKGKTIPVDYAYHEDVERGSSPMIFVSDNLTLVMTSYRIYSKASLKYKQQKYNGICFHD